MKNLKVLALVATLALGSGGVFAATGAQNETKETVSTAQEFSIELDTQDEDILKAFENGEVTIEIEDGLEVEATETAEESEAVQGFELQIDDEEVQKAFEAGEVTIEIEDEEMQIETVTVVTEDGIQIETGDAELAKAIENGEVTVIVEE